MNKANGTSLFRNSGKYYAIVGMFILTIAVVHFAMQMTFIQKETLRSVETVENKDAIAPPESFTPPEKSAPPQKNVIEIEPEQVEVKKIEVITIPEVVRAAPRRQKESVPVRKPVKKKETRETRAERLRRAERILTGV